jgi:hypothetical protein
MLSLDVLCLVLDNGRSRVVGPTHMYDPFFTLVDLERILLEVCINDLI